MHKSFRSKLPASFSFTHTIRSHGWYDLLPFRLDEQTDSLTYTFYGKSQNNIDGNGRESAVSIPVTIKLSSNGKDLRIDRFGDCSRDEAVAAARHILRLDENLDEFHGLVAHMKGTAWAAGAKAGRLLRSATVFEDLVKTVCTTNCSWSLTKKMVTNLVELLGEASPAGTKAFPTAAAMAEQGEQFYRNEIKAGYRSPYLVELAEKVASGRLIPEAWLHSALTTEELRKEIKKVKGIGDYAAENLLKLLGRYDGLALDSWLRSKFYEKYNGGKACPDKKIEKHYKIFGKWRGLAIWCDMTGDWFPG